MPKFLTALKSPGSLAALSDSLAVKVFCLTAIPKTTSVLYDSDCSTKLSHSFCHCLVIFSFALFLEMWACAPPAPPFSP